MAYQSTKKRSQHLKNDRNYPFAGIPKFSATLSQKISYLLIKSDVEGGDTKKKEGGVTKKKEGGRTDLEKACPLSMHILLR